MTTTTLRPLRAGRRMALAAAVALASGGAHASLAYGTLSNFDVYNDTGGETHGLEIDLEDVLPHEVGYTFHNGHYGSGVEVESIDANGVHHTTVRYAASWNTQSGSFSAATVPHPAGGAVATNGHTCISVVGCEHFGLSLFKNPVRVRYNWLVGNPTTGTLALGQAVDLVAPMWTVTPAPVPNQPPVVRAVIEAPEAEPGELRKPDALWVKVFKTELETAAELDDLMSGGAAVPEDEAETEVEWKLLQGVGDELANEDQPGANAAQIIRRYEYYAYTGAVDADNEALCLDGNCDAPGEGELGDLIAANMVALNLVPVEQPAPVPVPAGGALLLGALTTLAAATRRRRGD